MESSQGQTSHSNTEHVGMRDLTLGRLSGSIDFQWIVQDRRDGDLPLFYEGPVSGRELINLSVGRVLDLFDLDAGILERWEGLNSRSDNPPKNEEPNDSKTSRKTFGIK